MAKGQKRSNREIRKPKKAVAPALVAGPSKTPTLSDGPGKGALK